MEIKKYKTGDESKILELFKLAFGKEMSIEYWTWRFKSNPFSNEILIYLMWEENEIIGHYAVSPVEMIINSKITKTALSMTTMTDPKHNGKGIFTQLSSHLYDQLQNHLGYKMVWGFPNNNSHYAFIKNLNWKNIATIPILSLQLSKLKSITNISFEVIKNFDNEIASQFKNLDKLIKINKTTAYLDWRYTQNPFADYTILKLKSNLGCVVYKLINSFSKPDNYEIDILELNFSNDTNVLNELLNAIILNENKQIEQLNIWNSIFSSDYLLLKKAGFISQMPLTYLGYLNFDSNNILAENYANWEINFGYSDIF